MKFQLSHENDPLIERIENSVRNGSISHAYIIEGPVTVDKLDFAKQFARGILCPRRSGDDCGRCPVCQKIEHGNHEDLVFVSPLKGKASIGIDQIRAMQSQIGIKPNGPRYVVIIDESGLMTEAAQNCLLKTLEEPPGASVLLLLTENSEALLPTIRSRCIRIRLEGSTLVGDDPMARRADEILEHVLGGSPFYRSKKALGDVRDRQQTLELIDHMENRCRQLILSRDDNGVLYSPKEISECVDSLEKARTQLRQGLTPGSVMKRFLLRVGG